MHPANHGSAARGIPKPRAKSQASTANAPLPCNIDYFHPTSNPRRFNGSGVLHGRLNGLKPSIVRRVESVMRDDRITVGQVAERLGYAKLDTRLASAMRHRYRPNTELLGRLTKLLCRSK
jgi:hypothetical protein